MNTLSKIFAALNFWLFLTKIVFFRLTNGANGEMTSTTATKNGSNGRANSIHMMTENNGLDLNPDQEEPESLPLRVFLSLYFDTKVKLDRICWKSACKVYLRSRNYRLVASTNAPY